MIFSNSTMVAPEATADSIPVIHGQNYYINEQGYVCTYNEHNVTVLDANGDEVQVTSFQQLTENIFIVNANVAFLTSGGIVMTGLPAPYTDYAGSFQGIVGYTNGETKYSYINNTTERSNITFNARLNASSNVEIQVGNNWYVPSGEFRCYLGETFYNINSGTRILNPQSTTFTLTLVGWKTVELTDDTNHIGDIFIQGNTLYLSTRLQLIGSAPASWDMIDTKESTVVWSEDMRMVGSKFYGDPGSDKMFLVNYVTNTIYLTDSEFTLLQMYEPLNTLTGANVIDKYTLAITDKFGITLLSAGISLQTWNLKSSDIILFNQMSAYEEIPDILVPEDIAFVTPLSTIVIQSTLRANMLIKITSGKVTSIAQTTQDIRISKWGLYRLVSVGQGTNQLRQVTLVEDDADYEDLSAEKSSYDSWIYIGNDLEPDYGGSTFYDTMIQFEGKLAIVEDEDNIIVESSSDTGSGNVDLPVRTNQGNPENWWYLYSKSLRIPVSYTDWLKITMMPTTKIFNISLTPTVGLTEVPKQTKRKRKK